MGQSDGTEGGVSDGTEGEVSDGTEGGVNDGKREWSVMGPVSYTHLTLPTSSYV